MVQFLVFPDFSWSLFLISRGSNGFSSLHKGRTDQVYYLFSLCLSHPSLHPFLSHFKLQREGGPNTFLFCVCTYELTLSFSTSHTTTPFSYFPAFPHFFLNTMQRYFCQQNNYPCFKFQNNSYITIHLSI